MAPVCKTGSRKGFTGSNPVPTTRHFGLENSDCGFILASTESAIRPAHVAQSAERDLGKIEVTSSNLVVGSLCGIARRGEVAMAKKEFERTKGT